MGLGDAVSAAQTQGRIFCGILGASWKAFYALFIVFMARDRRRPVRRKMLFIF